MQSHLLEFNATGAPRTDLNFFKDFLTLQLGPLLFDGALQVSGVLYTGSIMS
jgi:hypothetical protein